MRFSSDGCNFVDCIELEPKIGHRQVADVYMQNAQARSTLPDEVQPEPSKPQQPCLRGAPDGYWKGVVRELCRNGNACVATCMLCPSFYEC